MPDMPSKAESAGGGGAKFAAQWNRLVDFVTAIHGGVTVESPLELIQTPQGIHIRLVGGPQHLRGKLNESLAGGSEDAFETASMSIWRLNADGDAWEDSDEDVDVYDMGFIPSSASPPEEDTWIQVVRRYGKWWYDGHDGQQHIRGKLDGSLARGTPTSMTSQTLSVWRIKSDGSGWEDSGANVTIFDSGFIPSAESSLSTNTWVQAVRLYGKWLYDGHDCG